MSNVETSRTSNSIRNTFYGIIHIVIETLLPFILRTVILKVFNEQYLGLNNLFHSILQVLSLAEAGFGTAISFVLYKPIAENRDDEVNALLNAYRKIFLSIGLFILLTGLLLIPFLNLLIKGSYPSNINIVIVYLVYLLETASNYLFFSEKSALLGVIQRSDIRHKIFIIVELISYLIRFLAIVLFNNYYLYIVIIPLTTISIRIIMEIISNKKYPNYYCMGNINEKQKKHILKLTKDIAIQNFSTVISSSLGSIAVSATYGLTSTAIYGNYNYVASALLSLSYVFVVSTTASVGNSVASKKVNENYYTFKKICFTNFWIISCFSTCLLCLYQDFMRLWAGENLTAPVSLAFLFTVYFYIFEFRKPVLSFKDACGIWKIDRFKPLVSGLLNCLLTLLLINKFGMLGPVLSIIICTVVIEIPWETIALFKGYFKNISIKEYAISAFNNLFVTAISMIICSLIRFNTNSIDLFIIKGAVIFIISNIIFVLLNIKNRLLKSTIKQIVTNIKF